MRAPLALSALLLVLRSPLPSLSENTQLTTVKPESAPSASLNQAVSTTAGLSSTEKVSALPTTTQVLRKSSVTPDQQTSVPPSLYSSDRHTTITTDPQDGSQGRPVTIPTSARPEDPSNKSGNPATTQPVSTVESQSKATQSQDPSPKTTASAPAPSLPSTGSSNTLTDVATTTSGSAPQGQHTSTTLPSSLGPVPDSALTPTPERMPSTQTSANMPPTTQQTSSMRPASELPASEVPTSPMPAGPVPGSQIPPSPPYSSSVTPQSTRSAVEIVTTPGVGVPTSLSTVSASQSPSIPAKPWNFGNKMVLCESLKEPIEKLLVLNLTSKGTNQGTNPDTTPCNNSLLNENLVTALCRAVKANFNPGQDSCTIQLALVPNSHAVAVRHITIQTNLLPTDVYKSLKDQWDELEELGVSDMKLGNDGPPEMAEDRYSMPLIITIVCMASFLLLVAALYGCCHQRFSQRKDQQRLTEELQTVENGYHDNPTLEVMETSSEMQEKKVVNLNGELGDSWIVPLDNLTKDDLDEEEDTHL